MLDIVTNFDSVAKKLPEQFFKDLSFAVSKTMQHSVVEGVKAGEKLAEKELQTQGLSDTGGPMIGGLRKNGLRAGLVRGWAPNRAQVAVNLRKGMVLTGNQYSEARVFIVNDKDPAKTGRSFDLVDEMYPLVFGGREYDTEVIPGTSVRGIITPTEGLMEGLKGRGRLKQLNKFGNITGLKQHLTTLLKSRDQRGLMFLNVPLYNTDPKTKHLRPGLYFRGREITNAYRGRRVKRTHLYRDQKRAEIGDGDRVRTYLVMLLAYHERRITKAQFPFDDVVADEMRKQFLSRRIFYSELTDAFASSFKSGRYGTRKFG